MEETANLLRVPVGHVLAKHGAPGFQQLWSLLRPAATQYIYGISVSQEACDKAADLLRVFARLLERMAISKEV
jgi:hypothetical protein